MSKKSKIIRKEVRNLTNIKKVDKAFEQIGLVFNDNKMNMAECLKVLHEVTVAVFRSRVDDAENQEDLLAILDIAEEHLRKLTRDVANTISVGD